MAVNMAEQAYSQHQRAYYPFINDLYAQIARGMRLGSCSMKRTIRESVGHPDDLPDHIELY